MLVGSSFAQDRNTFKREVRDMVGQVALGRFLSIDHGKREGLFPPQGMNLDFGGCTLEQRRGRQTVRRTLCQFRKMSSRAPKNRGICQPQGRLGHHHKIRWIRLVGGEGWGGTWVSTEFGTHITPYSVDPLISGTSHCVTGVNSRPWEISGCEAAVPQGQLNKALHVQK